MHEVTPIGLDLAKKVFQVHGADASKAQPKHPACLVGIEGCATSHYWARQISKLGHEVRLMPARYVKPYVKRNKNAPNTR